MKCYFYDKRCEKNLRVVFKTDPITKRHMETYHERKKTKKYESIDEFELKRLQIAASFFAADNGRYSMTESVGTNVFLNQLVNFTLKHKINPLQDNILR